MDFESSVARLPTELGELLGSLRQELEGVLTRYEEQLAEASGDDELISRVDTRYLTFTDLAGRTADLLAMGTDPDEVPEDLQAILVELFGSRPERHVIVLRACENPTFMTYQLRRPEQMHTVRGGGADLMAAGTHDLWLVSVFEIPRSFRYATLGQLLVIGHELAHAQDAITNFSYREAITDELRLPAESDLDEEISALVIPWLDEVLADLASVRRFGPAAVLVFAEYARFVQAYGQSIPLILWGRAFVEHPPAEVRLHLMFRALDELGISPEVIGDLGPALDEWREIAARGAAVPDGVSQALKAADRLLREAFARLQAQAASLVPPHQTYTDAGVRRARRLADLLAGGVAPSDSVDDQLRSTPVELGDLFNAAAFVRWVPRLLEQLMQAMGVTTDSVPSPEQRRARALRQLDLLLARAIEGQRLRRGWPAGLDQ